MVQRRHQTALCGLRQRGVVFVEHVVKGVGAAGHGVISWLAWSSLRWRLGCAALQGGTFELYATIAMNETAGAEAVRQAVTLSCIEEGN